jgi:DNA-binding NarL/FixJ family response regulator
VTLKIVIADDHGLLRAGLRTVLSAEPDIEVIGEAADGDTALELARALQPDVLVTDISMPGANGIEVARQARTLAPGTRVLIVTMFEDESLLRAALAAGAAGYLSKRSVTSDLIKAVRTVAGGETYMFREGPPPRQLAAPQVNARPDPDLTAKETELLRLIAQGYTGDQITGKLGLSAETAQRLRAELSSKLGLHNRAELIRYAIEHGIA